ncbi:MAG: DUF3078 domain-containing protein [Bacteroidaceae bacterium]|nr:DUF3078 domain-containing protein [Bacteroidaceae bacterium]
MSAQSLSSYSSKAHAIANHYQDSLKNLHKAVQDMVEHDSAFVYSPYMYRMTGTNMYYANAVRNAFSLDSEEDNAQQSLGMQYRNGLNNAIDQTLVRSYQENPGMFHYYDEQLKDETVEQTAAPVESKKEDLDEIVNNVQSIQDVSEVLDDVEFELEVKKPNFWKKSGKFTTQFTQSYFSENWYKGGSNNVTLLSTLLLEANYNDQKKVQWDNKLDLRLGFVSTPSDEFHKFMTNNDKIYLASKLGIKATKAWFYTVQADVNTQFLPGYRTNKNATFSKFLAPLDVFVSVGMDFKPTLKKGSFSAAILPLSYKMRYIGTDDDVNTIHNNYAMMKDGNPLTTKHDFGSKVELNAKFEIVKNLTWRSRAYYYTTYTYTEAEWENAFSFQFNKYLSTEVNALWRFDDNRAPSTKDSSLGYFQFKEYFTFGLAYNF